MLLKKWLLLFLLLLTGLLNYADNGYRLWLKYDKIENKQLLALYKNTMQQISISGNSPSIQKAKEELTIAAKGLLGISPKWNSSNSNLIIGTPESDKNIAALRLSALDQISNEGFLIVNKLLGGKPCTIITAKTDIGILYGVFELLRQIKTEQNISALQIVSSPKVKLRLLNHWDNLNRTVERGYAGASIWDWHKLPDYIDRRYIDYARANASIGINGTVLTNVNANATILTPQYLEKVAALANTFRPYGLKVYLTARFSAPIEIGGLKTADPLDANVKEWWKQKIKEIYTLIPDFGGFLVKANSEGQPGPQDYKRSHADGANMFADLLAP